MQVLFGRMGRMFGRLPSELVKLSAEDIGINVLCMEALDRHDAERVKQCKSVEPVFVVAQGG